ncbi:hypothetical protein M441DRAFT_242970 [Trichoderma asperellum CBS 433.97]|uniref:Uncharacterized protein n=1 Tax=Trichoderma asperellum (strain ATCC 204424 / CBS 433.97 / NBRC 101777) TaxID=1042311 RepID=A0A2T3Z2H8_TRIA4|nr:hypothetical protein M441DRAFT_242970 [Trichoderma asperellum CBS 433.97]PTB39019.1 hypothetical protein M441DRAFT_242970 [Trichoderma asperellum CBS 433.97]
MPCRCRYQHSPRPMPQITIHIATICVHLAPLVACPRCGSDNLRPCKFRGSCYDPLYLLPHKLRLLPRFSWPGKQFALHWVYKPALDLGFGSFNQAM